MTSVLPSGDSTTLTQKDAPPVDLEAFRHQRSPLERGLERLALLVEGPLERWIAAPQLNPLYYSGTLSILLLAIVGVTGVYLFFFFGYGIRESYRSVSIVEGLLTGRTIRAVHRYASGALLLTSLIHAYRLFFMGRSRGPRWLAWVSGVAGTLMVFLAGVTGYWLVMDQRAQLLTQAALSTLSALSASWGEAAAAYLVSIELSGQSVGIMFALFAAHFLLFLVLVGALWVHVLRLNRPKLLPAVYWLAAVAALMVVAAALVPAGLLPAANPQVQPGPIDLDPLFLFWLPAALGGQPLWIWAVIAAVLAGVAAIPWFGPRQQIAPPVVVTAAKCTGCTLCAVDCPYKAIQMAPRTDDQHHKFVAVVKPELCVSCGLCLASCEYQALTLGTQTAETLPELVAYRLEQIRKTAPEQPVKIVFTCERHAAQGARSFIDQTREVDGKLISVIAVPCVGSLQPNDLMKTLELGAAETKLIGCPLEDCAQRDGNLWAHNRLTRERLPRLRREYAGAAIAASFPAPDDFANCVRRSTAEIAGSAPWTNGPEPDKLPRGLAMIKRLTPRHYAAAFAFLAVILLGQAILTRVPFLLGNGQGAVAQIVLLDPARQLALASTERETSLSLTVIINGKVVWMRTIDPQALKGDRAAPIYAEVPISAGPAQIWFGAISARGDYTLVLQRERTTLRPGQIVRITPAPEPAPDRRVR